MTTKNLTEGGLFKTLVTFSLPYLFACFMQTFYGLADLFIVGQFNGSDTITAVAVGSQVMHMVTLVIAGIAMGTTVGVSRAVGAKNLGDVHSVVSSSFLLFAVLGLLVTAVTFWQEDAIIAVLQTPPEAVSQLRDYLMFCFAGIPLIAFFNLFSAVFRGMGDSRSPMIYVVSAGLVNIALDYVFVGPLGMGASGAALATVIAQGASVVMAVFGSRRLQLTRCFLHPRERASRSSTWQVLRVGVPTACQDGIVQVSFLVITAIANTRGVDVAAAVGIVEKIISFLFLVPSAMLAGVSAIAAQNAGAGKHDRSRKTMWYGMAVACGVGVLFSVVFQFAAGPTVSLFTQDEHVISLGAEYFRAYVFDCLFAAFHFCFGGYFCAYNKASWTFIHQIFGSLTVRIPFTYFAAVWYPQTLYPMGWAPPVGSIVSSVICLFVFLYYRNSAFSAIPASAHSTSPTKSSME